jgi:hypothetical protein
VPPQEDRPQRAFRPGGPAADRTLRRPNLAALEATIRSDVESLDDERAERRILMRSAAEADLLFPPRLSQGRAPPCESRSASPPPPHCWLVRRRSPERCAARRSTANLNCTGSGGKLDRLSRSLKDLLHIMEKIAGAGAGFRSLTENIDTTTPAAA